jgi:hypothetical protein
MTISRKLVRFIEYASVSASVVGAIASLTTQQPAYAIIPLSISAAINLISRRQRSQQLEDTLLRESQTASEFATQLQPINQRLNEVEQQTLNYQKDITALIETAAEQKSTERENTASVLQSIKSLHTRSLRQANQLVDIEDSQTQNSLAIESLTVAFNQVRAEEAQAEEAQAEIATALEDIQSTLRKFSEQIAQLEAQQTAQIEIQGQNNARQTAADEKAAQLRNQAEARISDLSADIERFKIDLEALTQQLSSLVAEPLEFVGETATEPNLDFSHVVPQLPTDDNYDLDINLGIDFGTGYTKVCLRDLALEQAEVVTFAGLAESGLTLDETLMPTRLAILSDGTLLTGLTVKEWQACDRPIKQNIDYIKMRLAAIDLGKNSQKEEWRLEQIAELDNDETVKSLCAYYLSQVIARSQQWAVQNRPEIFANRSVRWSVNLGVPVEYCDSKALKTFEKVLAIAWLIKSTDVDTSTLTIDSLNQLTRHLEQWAQTDEQIQQLDCTTTPEIVAAMWSFINSRQAQEGFYTFFDVGDGTLDGAAFIFNRADGSRKVDCYIGKVEPLGVSAFVEKTASELDLTPDHIRQSLVDSSDPLLSSQLQQSSTRRKIQQMVATVVMEGNEKHRQIRQFCVSDDIGQNLKVFIGGGGGNTDFFPETIQATHGDFQQGNSDIPPYKLRQIPTPEDLSINGLDKKDFNRFAIAYGLCIPDGENPEIRLPSQFQNIESASEISAYEPDPYEDGRDLM